MGERTIVHTDGSCDNGGTKVGGWAWVNLDAGTHGWGRPQTPTTNQRMELAAVLEAICSHPEESLTVVTDSRYAQQMFEAGWMARWERNGWDRKTSMAGREKPVENLDLVAAYHAVASAHPDLTIAWVKGHAGDEGNEAADVLAGKAALSGPAWTPPSTPERPQVSLF